MNKVVKKIITKSDLIENFKKLGLERGSIVELHVALSKFDYIVGGTQTLIDALIDVVTYEGTIVMAMHTNNNTDPSVWRYPPVEYNLMDDIRTCMPAFDKKNSDARNMGAVLDGFRRRDGIVHSMHPVYSYVAWGKYAKLICNHQSLNFPLAEESGTARLYELKAKCLLLGVDFDNATCLHLSEYRSGVRPIIVEGCKMISDNIDVFKKFLNLDLNSNDFIKGMIGFKNHYELFEAKIGDLNCKCFNINEGIDYLVSFFDKKMEGYYY